MITLSIPSSSSEFDRVLDFISLGNEIVDCSIEFWMELLDTVQKIFINIVRYAFPTMEGIIKINLNYIEEQHAIEISFFDEGIPYNPLESLGQSSELTSEKFLEGKPGVFILEKATEKTNYVYINNKNITTIKKFVD